MSMSSFNYEFDENPFEPRPLNPYKYSDVHNETTYPERDLHRNSRYCQHPVNQVVCQGNAAAWNEANFCEASKNTMSNIIVESDQTHAQYTIKSGVSQYSNTYSNYWHNEGQPCITTTETHNISTATPEPFDMFIDYMSNHLPTYQHGSVQYDNIPIRRDATIMNDFARPLMAPYPNQLHTNVNIIHSPDMFPCGTDTYVAPKTDQGDDVWYEVNKAEIDLHLQQQMAIGQSMDFSYRNIDYFHSKNGPIHGDATIMHDFVAPVVDTSHKVLHSSVNTTGMGPEIIYGDNAKCTTTQTSQGENVSNVISRDIDLPIRQQVTVRQSKNEERNFNHNVNGLVQEADSIPKTDIRNTSPKLNFAQRTWSKLKTKMENSRTTQAKLQQWDRRNGLPNSHSSTMMHTNRSRRQLAEDRILTKWNGDPLIPTTTTTLQENPDVHKPKPKRRKKS